MISKSELLVARNDRLKEVLGDASLLNSWAQVRSRHLLEKLAPEVADSIGYTYSVSRLQRVSTSALRTALLVLDGDPSDLRDLSEPLRRAAEIMEYLASLPGGPNPTSSQVISAGLYQLAGYEANSMCIARSVSIAPAMNRLDSSLSISEILGRWSILVLRRQFLRLRLETQAVLDGQNALEARWLAQAEGDPDADRLIELASIVAGALAYNTLSSSVMLGPSDEGAFGSAAADLTELLSLGGRAMELMQARTIRGVGQLILVNGLWHQMPSGLFDSGLWRRYVALAARGTSGNMLDATSRLELWESQRQALSQGLLEAHSGFSVRMPTSAGKTRIAELAIINQLISDPGSKALYVAPFRALADEVETSLAPVLSDLGYRASALIGGFDLDALEEEMVGMADLLIATPEKLSLLTRTHPELLATVGLIVLDEGHIIDDRERGVGYELLVTSLLQRVATGAKVVFISAVISSKNAADFAEWLCSDRKALVETEWRPTRRRVGIYNARRDRISYPQETMEGGKPVQSPFVIGAARPQSYVDYTPKKRQEKQVQFPKRTSKGQIAAELAIRFCDQGPVLVFVMTRANTESVARQILYGLQLRRQTVGADIPESFRSGRGSSGEGALQVAERWLGADAFVTSLLREGIAIHHAGLPDAVRRAIEIDFRRGAFPVLVATTTLAQGVNLPVKTAIVHSIARYAGQDDGTNRMDRINPRDFWNVVGRAGRAAQETEGHVLLVATNDRQAADYRQLLEQELPDIHGHLFAALDELTAARLTDDRFRQLLDSELVSLMVEESVGTSAETLFGELIGSSFVSIQAQQANSSLEALYDKAGQTIMAIREEVTDQQTMAVFSETGLDVRSCTALQRRIIESGEEIGELLCNDETQLERIVEVALSDVIDIPQMDTGYEFSGDLEELMLDWLREMPMPDIVQRHLPTGDDEKQFHRFLAELFAYRLPWGIGAYLRIAQHVLQPAEPFSELVRWLPTMVRYGVQSPSASWAMTLGCPSRELSTRMALAFVSSGRDVVPSYPGFVSWFADLREEDFVYRFDASPHEAEVLTRRAAALVNKGEAVSDLIASDDAALSITVVGLEYENRRSRAASVIVGTEVMLEREYNNQYDPNAVVVRIATGMLGYVGRSDARILAPLMDAGAGMRATVSAMMGERAAEMLELSVSVVGVRSPFLRAH